MSDFIPQSNPLFCYSSEIWNPILQNPPLKNRNSGEGNKHAYIILLHKSFSKKPSIKGRLRRIFKYLAFLILFLIPSSLPASYEIIQNIIQEVNTNEMMKTIYDLQENIDINSPDKSYKSRYCLRVRESSDPTDGACDNSAEYIYNKFASYGLDVEYDSFIHTITKKSDNNKEITESYKMRNVIATLPGKGVNKNMTYIICSHYDSIAGLSARWIWDWKTLPAPGANDNASGTAVVLESARILSKYDFDFTIKFITFSGEELGMFGSKYYAGNAWKLNQKIAGVINLDMLGYDPDELDIDIVTNEDSQWMANAIYYVLNEHYIDLKVNRTIDPKMIYSDHSSFWKSGYNAVLVTEGLDSMSNESSPMKHTPEDTIDNINPELLLKSAKLIIATLARLADSMIDDVIDIDLAINPIRILQLQHKSMIINTNINNYGIIDATGVKVQIWLIPPESWLLPVLLKELTLDIKANSFYELIEPIRLNSWGNNTIIIRINTDFHVFESNFTNNVARKIISLEDRLEISNFIIYPNPIIANKHSELNIRYSLSQNADVTLNIYDIVGELIYSQKIAIGENGGKLGPNNIKWVIDSHESKPIASGIYICYATVIGEDGKSQSIIRKLALIR
ncbi:TPA: Zn-dependent exopeptidase M28 [bacterium]|nr:Zn-dependent exopeptidase M28 [bacterium]